MELDLAGLIPAVVTPMHDDGRIDEESLRTYVRWLLAFAGLKAVAVNMDTGEGPHLLAGRAPPRARHLGERSRRPRPGARRHRRPEHRRGVRSRARRPAAGAAGLVVFPHPVFVGEPLPPDVPYEYHAAIAEASGLPMVIFQLQPALAGVLFSRETLLKLASIPNVVAIKEASFDAVRFVETVRVLAGGAAADPGPDRQRQLHPGVVPARRGRRTDRFRHARRRRADRDDPPPPRRRCHRARDGSTTTVVQPLADAIFAPPVRDYRARTKEALRELGVCTRPRCGAPLLPLDDAERERVREAVRRANLTGAAVA